MTTTANRPGTKGVPRPQREAHILDAAAHEFGHHGYTATTVTTVATRAGISKPLVYAYFDSKEGLSLACLHRAGQPLLDAVTDAQTPGTARQRAEATLHAVFTALTDRPHDWSVLYDPTLPRTGPVADAARHYRHGLNRLGAAGVAQIVTDPHDRDLLTRIWFATVTTTVHWWLEHPDTTAHDMTVRCHRMLTAVMGD
ncbi:MULTISPECIES: TetR/AcrR family transcriptional regulator [unclassified Nocardiopsis]|uniref:TetR/AcrR family transcriptional regulator n=1 Tax=Nocardiopsis TaxID=2013 RepID=UPI00387A89E3